MSSSTRTQSLRASVRQWRERRRDNAAFQRALESSGPAMRDELLLIAQRGGVR